MRRNVQKIKNYETPTLPLSPLLPLGNILKCHLRCSAAAFYLFYFFYYCCISELTSVFTVAARSPGVTRNECKAGPLIIRSAILFNVSAVEWKICQICTFYDFMTAVLLVTQGKEKFGFFYP